MNKEKKNNLFLLVAVTVFLLAVTATSVMAWLEGYGYRSLIEVDSNIIGPISVNGTQGIKGINYWTTNASVGESIYFYSVGADYSGNIAIANNTDRLKNYEIENSTGGLNPTLIWPNYIAKYH